MMAVFMIVTLAAIGVYLVTISTGQMAAASQDEQATRAYQAARAGVDWGAYQLLRNTGSTFATNCLALPLNGTYSQPPLLLASWLAGFYAEVKCQAAGTETEGGITVHVYRLIVTGCNGTPCGTATPTYVERQLQLTLTQCLPSSSYLPNSC
jgi:MSHA biogenesis protein MshP